MAGAGDALLIVQGVGHDGRAMIRSAQARLALAN
jgi:hypothetical protein